MNHNGNYFYIKQTLIKENEEFTLMLCAKCFNTKFKFLSSYENDDLITKNLHQTSEIKTESKLVKDTEIILNNEENKLSLLNKRKRPQSTDCAVEESKIELKKIEDIKSGHFLNDNWNNNICFCENCMIMYKDLGIFDFICLNEAKDDMEVNLTINEVIQTNQNQVILNMKSRV